MDERFLKCVPQYTCAVRCTLKKEGLSDQVSLGKTVLFIYIVENPVPIAILGSLRKSEGRKPV